MESQPKKRGRKKLPDSERKQQLNVYPTIIEVELVGGYSNACEIALKAVQGKARIQREQ